jgi:hypothetical protein
VNEKDNAMSWMHFQITDCGNVRCCTGTSQWMHRDIKQPPQRWDLWWWSWRIGRAWSDHELWFCVNTSWLTTSRECIYVAWVVVKICMMMMRSGIECTMRNCRLALCSGEGGKLLHSSSRKSKFYLVVS